MLGWSKAPDIQALNILLRSLTDLLAVYQGKGADLLQVFILDLHGIENDVVLNGAVQKQADALPVLGIP